VCVFLCDEPVLKANVNRVGRRTVFCGVVVSVVRWWVVVVPPMSVGARCCVGGGWGGWDCRGVWLLLGREKTGFFVELVVGFFSFNGPDTKAGWSQRRADNRDQTDLGNQITSTRRRKTFKWTLMLEWMLPFEFFWWCTLKEFLLGYALGKETKGIAVRLNSSRWCPKKFMGSNNNTWRSEWTVVKVFFFFYF